MNIVYFSSTSENTHRFVQKLRFDAPSGSAISPRALRIPIDPSVQLEVHEPYILICPTYAGGGTSRCGKVDTTGAVPKQVIHFLNKYENRSLCRAVISSGNTNFGDSFAIAGPIIAHKVGVPLIFQFELSGTMEDVALVSQLVSEEITIEQAQNACTHVKR